MRKLHTIAGALVIAAAAGTAATSADAARRGADPGYGYVTAESRYGGGTITAPVRPARNGRAEVRLPGGTWIECRFSCRDTLRRETVDFWKSREWPYGSAGDGVGYLHFEF
ncbi:MAG TPA: hypothetical protein VG900_09470 [Hyphomicrobiaceae bacterium]|jgi:hypothetical protein|nr:hypothetical protein [Hyphomicrobiaceae bacterium]